MVLKRVVVAHFSPTGGTKKVATILHKAFQEQSKVAGSFKTLPFNFLSPKLRAKRTPTFGPEDLLIFAYPVFFGRMPWAFENWPELKGNGARAIVVNVYGNRAIEDAERETMAFLSKHDFKILGKIDAIAEHSQERTLAHNRPDANDEQVLSQSVHMILHTIAKIGWDNLKPYPFDAKTPLKAPGKAPSVPVVIKPESCDKCLRCVTACPCGIINKDTLAVSEEDMALCMGCRACMSDCPDCNRGFSEQITQAIAKRMAQIKAANLQPKPVEIALSDMA